MKILSNKEILNKKLISIPLNYLKELSLNLGLSNKGSGSEIIKRIIEIQPDEKLIDDFIKQKFNQKIENRKKIISDSDLKNELMKVQNFTWGVVQGQLDQKIQTEYVRKFFHYDKLIENVQNKLHKDITNYVICTWFNHWTTVLIEEHISRHPKVVPILKNIKGVDIFFERQPFDLKITYLPKDYEPKYAIEKPKDLAIWMYEHQGAQRFGYDNRIFVVLFDKNNPENSWQLKRNFDLIFEKIDLFFNNEKISEQDEILFSFKKKTYTAITKILIITND